MPPTTRIILDTFTDAAVQGRIGRHLPRLFTLAGLTDMSVTPTVILSNAAFWRILYQDHVARLQDQLVLPGQDAGRWWAGLVEQAQAGTFLGGAIIILKIASRPLETNAAGHTPTTRRAPGLAH